MADQPCDHDFELSSYGGSPLRLTFRCSKCKAERHREATQKEAEFFKWPELGSDDDIHKVWHEVVRELTTEEGDAFDFDLVADWENRLTTLIERYPNHVQHVGCDDSYHSSSDLILVEHATQAAADRPKYMGTTVLYIPQCSGEKPIHFFLYPGHKMALMKALLVSMGVQEHVQYLEHLHEKIRAAKLPRWEGD